MRGLNRIVETVVITAFAAVLLAACGGGKDPGGRTSWNVRNSPVPVPHPKPRPYVPHAQPSKPVVTTVAVQTAAGWVTVARGDTVFALSRRYNADVKAIIRANGFEPPYGLSVGQKVKIPAGRIHVVKKGETGYGISRAFGVDLATLVRVNGLQPPYQVNVGQRLLLPANVNAAPVLGGASAIPTPETKAVLAPPSEPAPPPPPARGFDWPLHGRIISSYGAKPHGLHNDGINIQHPAGSLIKAADAGVVVYAGNDIRAYGNLILLKHQNGWITAYAHAEKILVARNETVRRGQPIARVGSTGNVTTPQLHFEIRQGRRTINPLKELPKR